MAVELATAYISLVPSATGIQAAIAKELNLDKVAADAGASASKKLGGSLLSNAQDTGKKLVAALGLATLGVAAFKSATDVEDANNLIVRSTGATGKALQGLQESFRNVASGSASSFEDISRTLAELNQRTGLTGKALESLTSEVTSFNRITKDAPITVGSLTTALAGFNVPANEMGKVLDHLFVISQKTGVPLADLLQTLQEAGPVARQFGFSVEFTAGFLAQLNKAGVDSNSVLPGLKRAFSEFAKAGKEPAEGLRETLSSMQALIKAGDVAQARQLAIQLFGPRGVGLVDAAISGKVSIDALNESIDTSGAGILDTAKKTGTLAGALGILRNNAKLALAEFATPAIEAANDALRGALPTIRAIGAEFRTLPAAVKVGSVGIVGLVAALAPLGNAAEGIKLLGSGFGKVVASIKTGGTLAGVVVLELIEKFNALTIAELAAAAAPFAIAAAIVAVGVGVGLALNSLVGEASNFAKALDAGKKSGASWAATIVAGAKASTDELARLRDARTTLLNQGKALTGDDDATIRKKAELNAAYNAVNREIGRVVQAQREEKSAQKETASSLGAYSSAILNGASATDAFAVLTDTAKQAVLEFQAAILGAAGGELGYEQSLRNVEKAQTDQAAASLNLLQAQEDSNAAVAEFGPDSKEAFDAYLKLQSAKEAVTDADLNLRNTQLASVGAMDQLEAAQKKLVEDLDAGTVSYDAERARLLEQIRLHPENAAGIQKEIDKLDEAKRFIDNLPTTPTHVPIAVDVTFNLLNANALQLAQAAGIDLDFTAQGGVFDTPQLRVFAEAGPEAVLPLSDPARSFQILAQSGLFDKLSVASAPAADVRDGGPLIGVINMLEPQDDPVRFSIRASKTLRAAQYLRG